MADKHNVSPHLRQGKPVRGHVRSSSGTTDEPELAAGAKAQAVTAAAHASSADDGCTDPPAKVHVADSEMLRGSFSVPEDVWAEWAEARQELCGGIDSVDDEAVKTVRRSEGAIRRIADEHADWLNELGLPGDKATEYADRYVSASIAMRDAARGPRPTTTAKFIFDWGDNAESGGPRFDPCSASCTIESEDGRKTLAIEDLAGGTVELSICRDNGWSHGQDEVAWFLTEDEARLVVSELSHRFGWDDVPRLSAQHDD